MKSVKDHDIRMNGGILPEADTGPGAGLVHESLRAELPRNLAAALLEALPNPSAVKDCRGRYRLVNHAFAQLYQRKPHELSGLTDHELHAADVARRQVLGDLSVIASGRPFQEEWRLEGREKVCWHLVVKTPLLDHFGVVTGILCTITDITRYRDSAREQVVNRFSLCSCCKRAQGPAAQPVAIDSDSPDSKTLPKPSFEQILCESCARQLLGTAPGGDSIDHQQDQPVGGLAFPHGAIPPEATSS